MRIAEILLTGLVLWTLLGLAGSGLLAMRGERGRARRGLLWVAGVWVLYVLVLLGVSAGRRQRVVAMGNEQCFDEMCFAVQGVDEVEGFRAKGQEGERLVRVRVRVANKGKGRPQSEGLVRGYLIDDQGRRWQEVRGLSGVRLTARVAAGDAVVSEPVFRVAKDAGGLGLVLTHGRWQPGVLTIDDPDSWRHAPTVMSLRR